MSDSTCAAILQSGGVPQIVVSQWPAVKKRIMIVGSSHARRLDLFFEVENDKTSRPAVRPHFGVAAAEVRVYGWEGLRVDGLLDEKSCREFETFQPHVAIPLIGGNDVLLIGDSDLIAHRLVTVATTLKRRFGLEHVYITQILPRFIRPRHKNERCDRLARASNKRVLSEVKQIAGISLIQLDFARFKCESPVRYHHLRQFYWDRVHLNWRGYKKLCQALRDAVIKASRLWSQWAVLNISGTLVFSALPMITFGYVCI